MLKAKGIEATHVSMFKTDTKFKVYTVNPHKQTKHECLTHAASNMPLILKIQNRMKQLYW